jgi:hypothetical protein
MASNPLSSNPEEHVMNLFNRIRANTPAAPDTTLGAGDVIPSDVRNTIATRGNAAITAATDFYKKNPKMVGGLAVLASAMLLNRMRSR